MIAVGALVGMTAERNTINADVLQRAGTGVNVGIYLLALNNDEIGRAGQQARILVPCIARTRGGRACKASAAFVESNIAGGLATLVNSVCACGVAGCPGLLHLYPQDAA